MRDFNIDGVLVGRPFQSVHEQSVVQKYPIGTIYEAFGRRWRYCRAAANITIARRGCPNLSQNPWDADGYSFGTNDCLATGIAGTNHFIITLGAAHDTALRTVDCFQGGILTLFPAAPRDDEIFEYRIIGNDLSYEVTIANDRVKIYVDPPLLEDWTAIPCDGMPSPYMNVGASGSVGTQASVVCVPEIQVTSGRFFWGQTKGPAWVTPSPGWNGAGLREAEWHINGCIKAGAGAGLQWAGYLLAESSDGDDAHIMLMLE